MVSANRAERLGRHIAVESVNSNTKNTRLGCASSLTATPEGVKSHVPVHSVFARRFRRNVQRPVPGEKRRTSEVTSKQEAAK
jgi:hypothetical protein